MGKRWSAAEINGGIQPVAGRDMTDALLQSDVDICINLI
jgi:hypothetical protein